MYNTKTTRKTLTPPNFPLVDLRFVSVCKKKSKKNPPYRYAAAAAAR